MLFVPSAFGFPAMVSAVPPLVVLVPAALAFGVEIAAALVGRVAVVAAVMDRSVESGLGSFDGVLAPRAFIGARQRRCRYEQEKRARH